ncbi:HNH endonuclease family protein [Nocardiopsis sp. NPDC006938]|uniref:HNH endonuclease family protein n=1 Tax=Nocardiopsis sp. NPDC006938 TaxID=3364337 RepID=UPI0036BE6600
MLRSPAVLAALPFAAVFLLAPSTAHAQAPTPLTEAIEALTVAEESREGYDRSLFPHWTDADRNGCNTRAEVLLEEAVTAPEVGERCRLSGGEWYSYYDDRSFTEARALDIDHMVPLAEAWDSGASQWSTQRRQAYANDLDEPVALVAVSASSNRSKADKDPSQWLPPAADTHCRYVTEWTTVKTRWGLTVDEAEREALNTVAQDCPDAVVETTPAP